MNYTKKAVKGILLVLVMMLLSYFLSYLIRIYLAKNLDVSSYGLFWSVFTFMMFFLIFRNIGFNSAEVKYIAEYNAKKDFSRIKTVIISSFVFQLLSSIILIAFFLFFSKYLAINFFKSYLASKMLSMLSLYIFFSLILGNLNSILTGFQEEKWYSLTESLRLGFAFIFSFLFFKLGYGVIAPVYGFILGVILSCLILAIGVSKYFFIFRHKAKDFFKITKKLFNFALPSLFTGFGNKIIGYTDTLILTWFIGLVGVGLYNAILPTAMMLLFFGKSISIVLFPMISELWSKKDKKRISEGMRLIYKYSFFISIPFIFLVFVFSEQTLLILFGKDYIKGVLAFRILLLGILFYIVAIINNTALSGIGKPKIVAKIILLAAVVNIIFNFLLIPLLGINGAAISTTLSYFLILTLSTFYLSKHIETKPHWKNWIFLFLLGFVFIAIIYYLKELIRLNLLAKLFLCFVPAFVIYFFLCKLFKLINIKEVKEFFKRALS